MYRVTFRSCKLRMYEARRNKFCIVAGWLPAGLEDIVVLLLCITWVIHYAMQRTVRLSVRPSVCTRRISKTVSNFGMKFLGQIHDVKRKPGIALGVLGSTGSKVTAIWIWRFCHKLTRTYKRNGWLSCVCAVVMNVGSRVQVPVHPWSFCTFLNAM